MSRSCDVLQFPPMRRARARRALPRHTTFMQSAGRPRNINPQELGPARGFSHATVAGDTVWLGGQIGSDASGRIVERGDLVRQYARAIGNVAIGLRAAGCTPEDTGKLTHFVTDVAVDREKLRPNGHAHREEFGRQQPRLTLIEV